jgi:hypothetical protein
MQSEFTQKWQKNETLLNLRVCVLKQAILMTQTDKWIGKKYLKLTLEFM